MITSRRNEFMDLTKAFAEHIAKHSLIEENDRILLALSGGKDSVCLFHLFLSLKDSIGFEFAAFHLHHGIRENEADRDLAFCRELCEQNHITFYFDRADVPFYCREKHLTCEEGARQIRYQKLLEIARREGYPKIATAHTASDQAETVLFRIIRGTGGKGIIGIRERRNGIIRPLLPFFKQDILDFLTERKLSFIEDSSNDDILYSRNRIRHIILKEMEMLNPDVEGALNRFSVILSRQEALLERCAKNFAQENGFSFDDKYIPVEALRHLIREDADLAILYKGLSFMCETENIVICYERFLQLVSLLKFPKEDKIIEISNGFSFRIKDGMLLFGKNETKAVCIEYKIPLPIDRNTPLADGWSIQIEKKQSGKVFNPQKNALSIHAAADAVKGSLYARNIQAGDRIVINKMTKRVKKLLCDAHIPKRIRNSLPLICDDEGILWLPFIGLSDRARTSESNEFFTITLNGAPCLQQEKTTSTDLAVKPH